MNNDTVLKVVQQEVDTLKKLMSIDAQSKIEIVNENDFLVAKVSFEGEDLGYMIGNRGLHLQGFQFVLSTIVKSKLRKETNQEEIRLAVLVDVGGYREQRVSKIERLAMQKADDARILGEAVDLLPMSAGDKRTVHEVLSKFDDIKTESFGEGRDRYVRITPLKEEEIGIELGVNESNNSEE